MNNITRCMLYITMALTITSIAVGKPEAAKSTLPNPSSLRLIPFPKQVKMQPGAFTITKGMVIYTCNSPASRQAANDLRHEILLATGIDCGIKFTPSRQRFSLIISSPRRFVRREESTLPKEIESTSEGYSLQIDANEAVVTSGFEPGLLNGVQTLRQLVRANMKGKSIPSLKVIDWPSMKMRGYSDDITRGPSPTLKMLKSEVETSSFLKSNFLTYYIEHQYAYPKLPLIGPKDGSLKPEELKSLIKYAKLFNMEIIGCQQSFGHFYEILKHDEYKSLSETPYIIDPTNEGSYKLLDDMYSAQAPLTESEFFNVCCDETDGLGTGPSKELTDKIGVGGVYAGHIKRIHDILKDKYKKRMMMWGDIILRHPENLKDIPKDTVMLTWGYEALPTFESQIEPFAKSGYDFLVCPGVNCWGRLIPDFDKAVINIQNFVRDGAKMGAMGMLNTTWDDSGENLFNYNWHGIAWGSECAWNGSTTNIADFDRRAGGVLFGEKGNHFGQAIKLLSKLPKLPGYENMMDPLFWRFNDGHLPVTKDTSRRQAKSIITIVEPALKHLYALKKEAKLSTEMIDSLIFAAERIRIMATRQLDFLDAAKIYEYAWQNASDKDKASALLIRASDTIKTIRDQHIALRDRYSSLWNIENRPYALDRVTNRFDSMINQYDVILTKMLNSAPALKNEGVLPSPTDIGLDVVEQGVRTTGPKQIITEDAQVAAVEWADSAFKKRIGIVIENGKSAASDRPIELDIPIAASVPNFFRLYKQDGSIKESIPVQLGAVDGHKRIYFIMSDELPTESKQSYFLYYDPDSSIADINLAKGTTLTKIDESSIWMENEQIRLMIGAEGGHIYRWEVKAHNNRDITEPGEKDWAGFADNYMQHRNPINRIEILAEGNVLVRVKCTDPLGMEKIISLWANSPWVEVTYNAPCSWFSCYDDISLMGADSPTPAQCLFSDGYSEQVRKNGDAASSQIARDNVNWVSKYVENGILFTLLTPETRTRLMAGPGSGMGGLMIEGGQPAAHFVIYGGSCPSSVPDTLNRLQTALDFTNQPTITVHSMMERK
ncbi:MAG: glycoside hydrolase family 20 zincin-like fold domain-containing protein [Armatimonadota bacterium]